jgi:dolichol-phosphate mannosyltransferase
VVDDNSPDGTGVAAQRLANRCDRIHVLHRPRKDGLGPAYVAGFRYALDWRAGTVAQMDADLSHEPADLRRLLQGLETCDVAIGSRYCDGLRVVGWSFKRLALSLAAARYTRLVLRLPVADPTSGFKCYRANALRLLPLTRMTSRGYSFQIETLYWLWRQGLRLEEIPIVFRERRRGSSKISTSILYEALYVLWKIRLNTAQHRTYARPAPRADIAAAAEEQRDQLPGTP